jgi:hypothetical protein
VFVEKKVEFGVVSVGCLRSRHATLKNTGATDVVFQIGSSNHSMLSVRMHRTRQR